MVPWFALLLSASCAQATLEYANPIVQEAADLGDPGALFHNGYYYLATSSGDMPDAYPIHRSSDLASWEFVGHVFPDWAAADSMGPKWAKGDFWAPDLQIVNGRFACYFSAKKPGLIGGVLSLGVAFSDNVTGPYVDIGKPLLSDALNRFGTIDVHYHETSAGEKYLIWKKNQNVALLELSAHIMMQRLSDDGASLGSEPAFAIATADRAWEKWGCIEAPWLLERNGFFYLFYSGSMVQYDTYAVGVARADAVTGPYVKKHGPVLHKCGYAPPSEARILREASSAAAASSSIAWTPGHCSVLPVAGQEDRWAMFYHGRNVDVPSDYRTIMMDELKWGADGWPFIEGDCPSSSATPVP